jgi:hypothetical protein
MKIVLLAFTITTLAAAGWLRSCPSILTNSSREVSDAEAGLLYGGACENGKAFKKGDNYCGTEYYQCDKGYPLVEQDVDGSFVKEERNCGVSECGKYDSSKRCAQSS